MLAYSRILCIVAHPIVLLTFLECVLSVGAQDAVPTIMKTICHLLLMILRIQGDLIRASLPKSGRYRKRSVRKRGLFARPSHSAGLVTFGGTSEARINKKKKKNSPRTEKITYNKFTIVSNPSETVRTVTDMAADQSTTPRVRGPVMPRPGAPGALQFDKNNITKFLRKWNQECDDYGLSDDQRCVRFPDYCTPNIETVVDCFSGYRKKDWAKFQEELKASFWQYDTQRDTIVQLRQLVLNGPKMDVGLYVIQYSAISDALVGVGSLTVYDRLNLFIDGLAPDLQEKVFDHAAQHNWRLSAGYVLGTAVTFETLRAYVEVLAGSEQRRMVYKQERSSRGIGDMNSAATVVPNVPSAPIVPEMPPPSVTKPASIIVNDPMAELQRSFEKLALVIEQKVAAPGAGAPNVPNSQYSARPTFRCNWCDEPGHYMNRCDDFQRARGKGVIFFNEYGRICSSATRKELFAAPGNGGFRRHVLEEGAPNEANASVITFEDGDEVIAVDIERDTKVRMASVTEGGSGGYEMMDGWVEEKRKRDGEEPERRSVRFRREDDAPVPVAEVPGPGIGRPISVATPLSEPAPKLPTPPKYRYESDLQRQIRPKDINQRVLDHTKVEISLREYYALSPEAAAGVHDLAQRRRRLVEDYVVSDGKSVRVHSNAVRALYACPSGYAKTLIDGETEVDALLDGGSELNIMRPHLYEDLRLPIDSDIQWKIGGFREGMQAERDSGLLGVCHDVKMEIGGVVFRVPVFVVEGGAHDLVLGRPWERLVRAQYDNRDDGTLWVTITEPGGLRQAKFLAQRGQHERNRENVRGAASLMRGKE